MDRFRHKSKKDKPMKHVDKDKMLTGTSLADEKSIKEYMKINEILRNVKINGSMRIKAPRGSNVMHNNDLHSNDEVIENGNISQESDKMAEAPNDKIVNENDTEQEPEVPHTDNNSLTCESEDITIEDENNQKIEENDKQISNGIGDDQLGDDTYNDEMPNEVMNKVMKDSLQMPTVTRRDRKLSLDHTMLSRLEGLSQSELDLNSLGKSPLERKSSFFKKKMDSFLKNTSEIFKRRSFTGKADNVERRNSMSLSLQSLNEESSLTRKDLELPIRQSHNNQGSVTSLNTTSTLGRSYSSLSTGLADRTYNPQQSIEDLAASQPVLASSQLVEASSDSVHSLNEACLQDSTLSSRAISMSSGLDSAKGLRKRTNSRSNRVSWLASEGLTNYFRRLIQDEKSTDSQLYYSSQDITSICENGPVLATKGRRLSYQRAVSGEDPVRSRESRKRRPISEKAEELSDLEVLLAQFNKHGVPPLKGYTTEVVSKEAFNYIFLVTKSPFLEEMFNWSTLPKQEQCRQAVIRELIKTEANYIKHMMAIVEVFLAGAHSLQHSGKLLYFDSERLFVNIPDILNANLYFWEATMVPLLEDSIMHHSEFNTELMYHSFSRFRDYFAPYEKFLAGQAKALDYLRSLSNHADFLLFLDWCYSQESCKRLMLMDFLVKPMQRLTKYSIILSRIIINTDYEPERSSLIAMHRYVKCYVTFLNRTITQKEELQKMAMLNNSIEPYEMEFKDDELNKMFKSYSSTNLLAPMIYCASNHKRYKIHQGSFRFKDVIKECDVEVFLCTDILLICKKQAKGLRYKQIRPKYPLDRMIVFPHYKPNTKEPISIHFLLLDEVSSACNGFWLTEMPSHKDSKDHTISNLKQLEFKLKQAKLCYDLCVFITKHPTSEYADYEPDTSSEFAPPGGSRSNLRLTEDQIIEREARELVAVMLHKNPTPSYQEDWQTKMVSDSFDEDAVRGIIYSIKPNLPGARFILRRDSIGESSNTSRISSLQKSVSNEDPELIDSYPTGSSVEHLIPPQNPDEAATSITVNVSSESETVAEDPTPPSSPAPGLSAQVSGTYSRPPVRSLRRATGRYGRQAMGRGQVHPGGRVPVPPGRGQIPCSRVPMTEPPVYCQCSNTLQVESSSAAVSLPDLSENSTSSTPAPESPLTQTQVSEILFQLHVELLERNRINAAQTHQYLSPDTRGTSYPPPSPTRGMLKRGLAFSQSIKHPPLTKMGHVLSQSLLASDAGPSTSQQAKVHAGKTQVSGDSKNKGKLMKTKNKSVDVESKVSEEKPVKGKGIGKGQKAKTKVDLTSVAEDQKNETKVGEISITVKQTDKHKQQRVTIAVGQIEKAEDDKGSTAKEQKEIVDEEVKVVESESTSSSMAEGDSYKTMRN